MIPVGTLKIEYWLVERMIALMEVQLRSVRRNGEETQTNSRFAETAARFIRTFAHHCQHGGEEDTLFDKLKNKPISNRYKELLDDLMEEHRRGREVTEKLIKANTRYEQGEVDVIPEIIDCLGFLLSFYPRHIRKEDQFFFKPVMKHFSESERRAMVEEGYDFARRMQICQRYLDIVSTLEEIIGAGEMETSQDGLTPFGRAEAV